MEADLGGLDATARGRVTAGEKASLEDRVLVLESNVEQLHGELGEVSHKLDVESGVRSHEIERIHASLARVRKDIEAGHDSQADIDARALPSVGVGILLLGLPDQAMDHLWAEIVALVLAGVAVTTYVLARWFDPSRIEMRTRS